MDPALRSSDLTDRAASAEPSSTRPNPFDDGDISSRKRRRTSLSGSPANSLDAANPAHDSSSSTTLDTDPPLSGPGVAAHARSEPVAPKTPELGSAMCDPSTEPPSSMVTLNLRNAPQDDSSSSSPPSPSPAAQPEATDTAINATNEVKASVEDSEVDMVPVPTQSFGTPQSASSRSTSSPPIEIITVQSDEDMISDRQSVDLSIIGEDLVLIDPIRDFPFNEPDETLVGTVNRLTNYLSNHSPIDDSVFDKLQQWLEQYLRYTKDVDQQSASDSCRLNHSFWVTFPDIVYTMASRKPPLWKEEVLRSVVVTFFLDFTKLTAWFVKLDHLTLQEFSLAQTDQSPRMPQLISPNYLQQLHLLTQPQSLDDEAGQASLSSNYQDETAFFVKEFQDSEGGDLSCLFQLARGVVELVPTLPKLTDDLAPICQVASDVMTDAVFNLCRPESALMANHRLEVGLNLCDLVTDTLEKMIEKQPTRLNIDNVATSARALTCMIKMSLQGDHEAARNLLQEHRKAFPELPLNYTVEAIAWERRFCILNKLIRSSQMQLRVLGVTMMCGDLVSCWRRHGTAGDDGSISHLNHLAGYLLRTGLIEYILGSNCHPEITLEGANIIGFLVVTKMYREEHLNLIWQGITSGQDPRTVDALTRMVASIANLFDYEGLLQFCEKFQTLPLDNFTPATRLLWENVMRNMVSRSGVDRQTLSFHPYNLCLRLLRESSVCTSGSQVAHPDLQNAAMQKFKELLAYGPDPDGRQQLYHSCIEDIANKSATTLGSLWCLSMAIRPAVAAELRILSEEHALTRLIVNELEHAIEAGRTAGVQVVLWGPINQSRRDFITNIIQLEPQTITEELGVRLWDMLVGPRSLSPEDRKAGWAILNNLNRKINPANPFLQTCLSQYLPTLPSEYFCDGMLDFLRAEILPRLNLDGDLALDDSAMVDGSGIEQLWRMILEADDGGLVDRSVRTLAIDIYIESRHIATSSLPRTRQIHLALVNRCLQQLKDAARKIKTSNEGTMSGDDEPMVIVATDEQTQQQERIFTRSLKLLRYTLEAHQSKPLLSAPDLRTLISQTPHEVQGDSAELKYQSFDGDQQTEVKLLHIGKLNTAASLLASLRQETGFENYRVYYRGRPFLPNEHEICKSLEDLRIHDGLILVKREEAGPTPSGRVKPGASPLEVEISAHFDEMWEYLSMDETLASEIHSFLIKLPTDGHLLKSIDSEETSYMDVFPPGQPFKSLYAVHILAEYIEAASLGRITSNEGFKHDSEGVDSQSMSYTRILKTSTLFVVQAISDESIFDRASVALRLRLTGALIHAFRRFLDKLGTPNGSVTTKDVEMPEPARLVEILAHAAACPGEAPFPVITGTLAVTLRLSMFDSQFWAKLRTNPDFARVLHCLLLTDPRNAIRGLAARLIEELFSAFAHTSVADKSNDQTSHRSGDNSLAQYFWSVVGDLVLQIAEFPYQCDELFRLAHFLLVRINAQSPELLDVTKLVAQISNLLLAHTSTETIGSLGVEDSLAKGLASLLHLCLQLDGSVAQSAALPANLPLKLLWRQLYPTKRSQSEQPVPRVVLHGETRAKLCDIVFSLVKHDKDKTMAVLEALDGFVPFYDDDDEGMSSDPPSSQLLTPELDDPYLYELPYQFERQKALRAPCGYVGLQNLSNTCYLNSLLTQLYMNTGFRQFILNSRPRDPGNSQQLLFYTQKLFSYMQESYRRFIDPTNLVSSIRTYDDTLIDVHNQMDVDEFYNLLFDRWEGQFLGHDEKRKLKSFYGGQLVQQVKSKECEHISERLEPFSAIQCDIKGKNTLEDSLQAYVDGEIMEGDNKYKCSTCDRHVDAVKRACLKDIPDNVIFHLKRFDFNLRTLQRSKINDYFSFPAQVNLRPYTIEHLSNPENDTEEDIFELVGVLVHSGTAESGHYYSYIRERPSSSSRQTWVEFNDDLVTPWDPAHLESSTFGGPDHRPPFDTNGILYDKTYSAYMLFYQRASSLRAEQDAMMNLSVPGPLRMELSDDLKEHIMAENTVILRRHCIYDPSHLRLVQMLFSQARQHCGGPSEAGISQRAEEHLANRSQGHELQDLAMQTLLSHFDQVVTRAKDMPDFASLSNLIKEALATCHDCAFAFYNYFDQRRDALRALLQRNPDQGVRSFTSKQFIEAVAKIAAGLPHVYDQPIPDSPVSDADGDEDIAGRGVARRSVIDGVMMLFNHMWKFFHIHIRAWDEYFGAILDFARLGGREAGYLLAGDYLARVLRIISADPSQELPGNYARMLHNVLRRINTTRPPPSYISIIRLVRHLFGQLEPELSAEVIVEEPTERLERMELPFSWTSNEVQLVHGGLDESPSSLFVEKLLGLDQLPKDTDDIIRLLVGIGSAMDFKILVTLKRCIRGETSTQAMDPFLRAACVYIENTEQLDYATKMMQHVYLQAKSLQNTEGVYFVRFFKTALHVKRPEDDDFGRTLRSLSLQLVPKWTPFLLAYSDASVRRQTESFFKQELLPPLATDSPDDENSRDDRDDIRQTLKHTGLMCLKYLQEHHVRRRAHMSHEIASMFLWTVEVGARVVDADPGTQSELDTEYLAMQRDVIDPLRRLMVEDMEEDGSDWEGSGGSSDQIDDTVEMNIPGMNEINDVDLV
ncbi:hypothetical protein FZEAL_5233 [Fusarium zealandicum]|uniref:USP domain-containing protein n=1 Tax=Fusarium zealandicum TaxID=1053134 RepID=A0A8H4UKT1_9HYPO|nr:hypothetical protein FZEAL_5233 [Fusarium zealandicum]